MADALRLYRRVALAGCFALERPEHRYQLEVARQLAHEVMLPDAQTGQGAWPDRVHQGRAENCEAWLSAHWQDRARAGRLPFLPLDHGPTGLPPRQGKAPTVVLFGADCTGKSTLARALADAVGGVAGVEAVRTWFDAYDNQCSVADAKRMAWLQAASNRALAKLAAGRPLFLDTDALASVMWYEHYHGPAPADMLALAQQEKADYYLLLETDIAYQQDHQRAHTDRRELSSPQAVATLQRFGCRFLRVAGQGEQRLMQAKAAVAALHQP
ncbi:AAA family ATPase [Leeia sp.]|uniref:AAA family ATPase n=1 Tax=Leeia sp. TaxID=2884678 RepID=UPI0035B15E5D